MNWMADILTMLGEHFPLMLILSVEVIAAVALAVAAIGRRRIRRNTGIFADRNPSSCMSWGSGKARSVSCCGGRI